uniref:Uncharacterized protein n=1 Tax=viral metagenome TaxID=1070528 RepID=A0A6H1ZLG5_9ZZZZ
MSLIDILVDEYDADSADKLAMEYMMDSICPAICTKCAAIYEYEPDCDAGWCGECNTNSVQSLLVLLYMI